MYLMKEEKGEPIPTSRERWHSRTSSISPTLPVFHHPRHVQRAAVLWTFSSWLIWSFEYGLQKGAAYSSLGLIKVLYATSLVLVVAKAKFLWRKPSALVALEEISEMCWPQSILSEMVISRYLADWTFPKFSCEGNNQKEFVCNADAESLYDRVTLIEWHLATLNFICQWLATDRRPYVIWQVIYKSKEQDRSYIPSPPPPTHTHFQT